jgi:acyl transferase domain-containing protein
MMVFTDVEMTVGLLPGQGAYQPGLLQRSWDQQQGPVADVFGAVDAAAANFFGQKCTARIFDGSSPTAEELLADAPDLLQLAIFGMSVAAFRMIVDQGARPTVLMGHSLGEIAALVCAGALTTADGAEIVAHRAIALQESPDGRGMLLALSCLPDTVNSILALVDDPRVVLAAINAPNQVVVSGPESGIRTVSTVASAVGISTVTLPAGHPFHNPVLASAGAEFVRKIDGYQQYPLQTAVFSPILGRFYRDSDDIARLLGTHLVTPVQFAAAASRFHGSGARIFVELGAGSTLVDLVRRNHSDIVGITTLTGADEEETIAATAAFLTGGPSAVGVAQPVDSALPTLAATATPARQSPGSPSWSRPEVLAKVRSLYATALEYPEEVLTEDAVLEADLGVDSVKRVGLANQVWDDLGLQTPPRSTVGDLTTFGDVVDSVCAALDGAERSA